MSNDKNIGVEKNSGEINGGFIAGVMNFNLSPAEDNDKSLACAHCGQDADANDIQENGKINCKKCSLDFFVIKPQSKNTTMYLNVPADLQNAYHNIIFRIDLKIEEGSYKEANLICDEAIKLYSLTPRGLEYKALCLYFTTPRQEIIIDSARKILVYLNKAREIDTTSKTGENIAASIAFKYYRMLRYRIQNQSKQTDVNELYKLISEFNTCYKIFPSSQSLQFLKTQVSHLSGREGYSFIIPVEDNVSAPTSQKYKEIRGNTKEEVYFLKEITNSSNNVFQTLSNLEKEIQKVEPSYRLPILQIEYDKKIIRTDTYLLIKQEERERIIREEQIRQERITWEAHERQNRIVRLEQERKARIALEEQRWQARIDREVQEKRERIRRLRNFVGVIIASCFTSLYWEPVFGFVKIVVVSLMLFLKFAAGIAAILGLIYVMSMIKKSSE
jgi:DNA-directed RNA polymerase subunit RPC12/RpoP